MTVTFFVDDAEKSKIDPQTLNNYLQKIFKTKFTKDIYIKIDPEGHVNINLDSIDLDLESKILNILKDQQTSAQLSNIKITPEKQYSLCLKINSNQIPDTKDLTNKIDEIIKNYSNLEKNSSSSVNNNISKQEKSHTLNPYKKNTKIFYINFFKYNWEKDNIIEIKLHIEKNLSIQEKFTIEIQCKNQSSVPDNWITKDDSTQEYIKNKNYDEVIQTLGEFVNKILPYLDQIQKQKPVDKEDEKK